MQVTKSKLRNLIREQMNRSQVKLYHTSRTRISHLRSSPLWFATELEHATEGWAVSDRGQESFVYEATFTGVMAHENDPAIESLFEMEGVDPDEYIDELTSNPESDTVMNDPATQILVQNGYDGFQHTDYDPRDWDKNLPSVVVFNPAESISSFTQV